MSYTARRLADLHIPPRKDWPRCPSCTQYMDRIEHPEGPFFKCSETPCARYQTTDVAWNEREAWYRAHPEASRGKEGAQ